MKTEILGVLLLLGCATAPKPVPHAEPSTAPPAAPAPKPVEEAPVKAEVKADDLDALLKGLAIHFDFDRADLTTESQRRLDALADSLRANSKTSIKVAGNCDELGTEEYNLALGQKRADAVKTYLAHLGVDAVRIDTVTYGEEKPLDESHTPEAWAANRRGDVFRN